MHNSEFNSLQQCATSGTCCSERLSGWSRLHCYVRQRTQVRVLSEKVVCVIFERNWRKKRSDNRCGSASYFVSRESNFATLLSGTFLACYTYFVQCIYTTTVYVYVFIISLSYHRFFFSPLVVVFFGFLLLQYIQFLVLIHLNFINTICS